MSEVCLSIQHCTSPFSSWVGVAYMIAMALREEKQLCLSCSGVQLTLDIAASCVGNWFQILTWEG